MIGRLFNKGKRPREGTWKVSFNVKPVPDSWGGQNQFVHQMREKLEADGHQVVFHLDRHVTHIMMLSVYDYQTVTYLPEDIRAFKTKYPHVKVLHRINDNDVRKGTDNVDPAMIAANDLADLTVYISSWLRDYFHGKGVPVDRKSCVIHNAVNDDVFYPEEVAPEMDTFWLVTHHWSDHWMKGFHEYVEIDRMISDGELPGFGFRVIGKWPEEIQWRATETHVPTQGYELADKLRENHLYVTASRWEPGGMHFIEGLQCGLPVVFHEDGGGICEVAEPFGCGFRNNLREVLLKAREKWSALRSELLTSTSRPSGKAMVECFYKALKEL